MCEIMCTDLLVIFSAIIVAISGGVHESDEKSSHRYILIVVSLASLLNL